jgi:hypothetical protein
MLVFFLQFNLMASCHSQVSLMLRTLLTLQKPQIPANFNIYLVINKCVTRVKVSNFSGHYLRNRNSHHFYRQRNVFILNILHYMFQPQRVIIRCYNLCIQLLNCNVYIYICIHVLLKCLQFGLWVVNITNNYFYCIG